MALEYDALLKGCLTREEAEAIISLNDLPNELLEAVGKLRRESGNGEIRFYYPIPRFPNVSVTGASCALSCKHCGGHYLAGMRNADTPLKLKELCERLDRDGGVGVLVSGGSDLHGRVPLERFYDTLRWVKENTELIINVHTGLLDREQAEELASTEIDIVSVDVVGCDETIKRVYGLDATVTDYAETLRSLEDADVSNIVPHICVGLDFGQIRGEARALGVIQESDPEVIVILGLIPTMGTPMEGLAPPSSLDISRVVAAARLMCPEAGIAIGCMRSRTDKARVERLAITAGADRIVLPANSTVQDAINEGFAVKHLDGCCAIPRSLEHLALRG